MFVCVLPLVCARISRYLLCARISCVGMPNICERVLIICVGMRIMCACMGGTLFLASTHKSRQSRMFSSTSEENLNGQS
jgi:hypothetical protein